MTADPIRMVCTGIRREWVGPNFYLYTLMIGGEYRQPRGFHGVEILYVPESELLDLWPEYLPYEPKCDDSWLPLGNQAMVGNQCQSDRVIEIDLPICQLVAQAEVA